MEAIAHNKAFAKKVGVPQSVGQDFSNADKGKTFKKGGDIMMMKKKPMMPMGGKMAKDNQPMPGVGGGMSQPGTPGMMKKGGMAKKMAEGGKADMTQDKAMIKKAIKQHDAQEHKGGKGTKLSLKKGGTFRTSANGVAKKGLTRAMMPKMKGKTI
jgi:hypothetical protein